MSGPAKFTLEAAIKACAESNGRVGEFYEVKAKLEGDNEFAKFALTIDGDKSKLANAGFIWSNTKIGNDNHVRYVYGLDTAKSELGSLFNVVEKENANGFVMCFY